MRRRRWLDLDTGNLIRSRYLLFKNKDQWTRGQRQRAEIFFHYYPFLEVVYKLPLATKEYLLYSQGQKSSSYPFSPVV